MNADYALIFDAAVDGPSAHFVRRCDGAFIPADPDNADWRAYQAWLAAGHTPDAALAPAPPACAAPLWSVQAALKQKGDYETINAAMTQAADPALYFVWTMGNMVAPRSKLANAIARHLNLDDRALDDLFRFAADIAQSAE
jgi:hypothetical protein